MHSTRVHEDSRPVTIPSVDSTVHEYNLSSTFYVFPPWNQGMTAAVPCDAQLTLWSCLR